MTYLNKQEQKIEAREKGATPGPWCVRTFVNLFEIYDKHWSRIHNGGVNRKFIEEAHEDIPYLLETIEMLRKERRE